jgi:hypothetical protein
MKTRIVVTLLIAVLLLNFMMILTMAQAPLEPHNADAMWIQPSASNFDTTNASVGFDFNITVGLNMTEDVFAYQTVIYYNKTQLNCTRVAVTTPPTSEYFTGHATTVAKGIDSSAYGKGSVAVSETCSGTDFIPGPRNATLFWAEFQIIIAPNPGQTLMNAFNITKSYAATDTYVWDVNTNPLTLTPYDGTYQFTGPSGPPPLSVSISPANPAPIVVNQTQLFTSNPTGGTKPYSFQWFINGTPASGANSSTFTFSEPTNGNYDVYLNVTDQNGTIAESNTAVVTVTQQAPPPPPGHDVAVVGVTPSVFEVYKGESINVTVTVVNNGTFDEVVNVTLYYNFTAGQTIGMQTANVNFGQYLIIIFTWNTSNVAYAYHPGYTITAVANITNDNTPGDNTLSGGTVKVKIVGDIDGNGRVDGRDLVEAAKAFGTVPGYPRWNPDADINQDGKIDGKDLVKVAINLWKQAF